MLYLATLALFGYFVNNFMVLCVQYIGNVIGLWHSEQKFLGGVGNLGPMKGYCGEEK